MARIHIEDIQREVAQDNWKVISEEYINLETEMRFECAEGHTVYNNWKKLRNKRECPICKVNVYKDMDYKIVPKKKGCFRYLGLDQATKISGFSIFDDKVLVQYGTFEINLDNEIARDHAIRTWLINVINSWKPDVVGIEGIQFQENKGGQRAIGVTVFETLARLQGILMQTCFELKTSYVICPTNTWRAHCGVKGQSRTDKKRSMQLLAKKWYDITVSDDEADAIGIGKYISETGQCQAEVKNWE